MDKPNIIFVFGDQWRLQATGYSGNSQVITPNIDALENESINFTRAVAGCPVCSPYRASFLTGLHPLTHGVFVNDVPLDPSTVSIADVLKQEGYDTAYIGKWHVNGYNRTGYIPPERRMGFDYWKVLECTHDYNHSAYYDNDSKELSYWEGYDASAQTDDAVSYIRNHDQQHPFFLVLSWGPPHSPYQTAPEKFRALYDPASIELRGNVPEESREQVREQIAGYYAHCSALDSYTDLLMKTLKETGLEDDTIFIFTSDHGDMLGSQGERKKQRPWDESIRVPFLFRWPGMKNWEPRKTDAVIDAPDIMPTLLGLCGIDIPETVEGIDFSDHIQGGDEPGDGSAVIMCPHPFGEWTREQSGGREYRGLRTKRYTYVRTLEGPWLLYDNEKDPLQMNNVLDNGEYSDVRADLDRLLWEKLKERGDDFLPGMEYIWKWNYPVDESETVPFNFK